VIWDYHTLKRRQGQPGLTKAKNTLGHPFRCRQDGRYVTVLIDGGDPFREEVSDVDRALVFQEMEQLPGLRFVITTPHLHAAKFFIRNRSEAQVKYALKWQKHKDHEKRTCPAALAAIALAQQPYLPNLTLHFEQILRADLCAVRLGGGADTVFVPLT
jgi:hypothetical protein